VVVNVRGFSEIRIKYTVGIHNKNSKPIMKTVSYILAE
jgi:hypothetical protein